MTVSILIISVLVILFVLCSFVIYVSLKDNKEAKTKRKDTISSSLGVCKKSGIKGKNDVSSSPVNSDYEEEWSKSRAYSEYIGITGMVGTERGSTGVVLFVPTTDRGETGSSGVFNYKSKQILKQPIELSKEDGTEIELFGALDN